MAQQTYGEWMRSNPPIPNLTAVEWLAEKLEELYGNDNPWFDIPSSFLEQAKQIEKEQIIKAIVDWYSMDFESAEQYYKETYNK